MKPPSRKKPVRPPSAKPPAQNPLVKALKAVEHLFQQVEKHLRKVQKQLEETDETVEAIDQKTRIIHIFDREGDIAEVFDQVRQIVRIQVGGIDKGDTWGRGAQL